MSNPNPPSAAKAAPAVAPRTVKTSLLPIPEEMMRTVRFAPDPFEYIVEALMNGYSLEQFVKEDLLGVNDVDRWPNAKGEKTTLLLSAIEMHRFDAVRELLKLGANPRCRTKGGGGALDCAARGPDANYRIVGRRGDRATKIAEMLIRSGAPLLISRETYDKTRHVKYTLFDAIGANTCSFQSIVIKSKLV